MQDEAKASKGSSAAFVAFCAQQDNNQHQQDPCLYGHLDSLQRFTQLPFALAEALVFLRTSCTLLSLLQGPRA